MGIKIANGAYPTGYQLTSASNTLTLTPTGFVGGQGVFTASTVTAAYQVYNYGTISGDVFSGVSLADGGYVLNQSTGGAVAQIGGTIGVDIGKAAGTVHNYGSIVGAVGGGVQLLDGGSVINSSVGGATAVIAGRDSGVEITGASGTVTNYGSIITNEQYAVYLALGGTVTNGSNFDTTASIGGEGIGGGGGVLLHTIGTVINNGTILGTSNLSTGVHLVEGGRTTNGDSGDSTALIDAGLGVATGGPVASTVTNFGTIEGVFAVGVSLGDGGLITNGSRGDTQALIKGASIAVEISGATGTVQNLATVLSTGGAGDSGVEMQAGGILSNGAAGETAALIEGYEGVLITGAAATMSNFGAVLATGVGGDYGVKITDGGRLTNGAPGDHGALIDGYGGVSFSGAGGTFLNFGTILGTGDGAGVTLSAGGVVTNGSSSDLSALIQGYGGVLFSSAAGTVKNFGAIVATGATSGAGLSDGGSVTNGAAGDHSALIDGYEGVLVSGAAGTLLNFGSIVATGGGAGAYGVKLAAGGSLTSGSAADEGAIVQGYAGVVVSGGAAAVTNFGSILSTGGADEYAVSLADGGRLTNGSAGDHTALVEGYAGVAISGGAGTVANFGSIVATGAGAGVDLSAGGSVTNGSVTDATALIQGYRGLQLQDGGTAVNFGAILGNSAGNSDVGAANLVGGSLTNGAANDTTARIDGYTGVYLAEGATLTNFGTIVGQGAFAVYDQYDLVSTVAAEAGAAFVGEVRMNGGSLDLVAGVVTMGGLETSGTVSGAGTLALDAGLSTFSTGASLAISQIAVSGATTTVDVEIASLTYAGTWLQSAGTLDVFSGDKATFTGTSDTFAGTVTGTGSVVWSGGSDAFSGLTLSATSQTVSGAAITFSGVINLTTNMSLTSSNLVVAASGATIGGTGEFIVSSNATNSVYGATSGATLTVNGKVYGAGQLGDGEMTLIIGAGGFVDGYTATALTINTGASAITNAGTIFAIGAGGTVVDSAVTNTGKLYADGGTLTLEGAVTGAGVGDITSGTLFAASSFTENVTFTASTTGTLELADSQTYTGDVTGFSLTGTTTLDLNDIDFINGTTKATYSGTATSGTLTVTDGTHTAHITLEGNYTSSTFTVSSDGHGGTKVVDPSKAPAGGQLPASPHPLIAAIASVGAPASAHLPGPTLSHRPQADLIAAPRGALA